MSAFMTPQNENTDYPAKAKQVVTDWVDGEMLSTGSATPYDVYVVWFSKTLQNWKALVATTLLDGLYFEVTHNGDRGQTYLDVYKKIENRTIKD